MILTITAELPRAVVVLPCGSDSSNLKFTCTASGQHLPTSPQLSDSASESECYDSSYDSEATLVGERSPLPQHAVVQDTTTDTASGTLTAAEISSVPPLSDYHRHRNAHYRYTRIKTARKVRDRQAYIECTRAR